MQNVFAKINILVHIPKLTTLFSIWEPNFKIFKLWVKQPPKQSLAQHSPTPPCPNPRIHVHAHTEPLQYPYANMTVWVWGHLPCRQFNQSLKWHSHVPAHTKADVALRFTKLLKLLTSKTHLYLATPEWGIKGFTYVPILNLSIKPMLFLWELIYMHIYQPHMLIPCCFMPARHVYES